MGKIYLKTILLGFLLISFTLFPFIIPPLLNQNFEKSFFISLIILIIYGILLFYFSDLITYKIFQKRKYKIPIYSRFNERLICSNYKGKEFNEQIIKTNEYHIVDYYKSNRGRSNATILYIEISKDLLYEAITFGNKYYLPNTFQYKIEKKLIIEKHNKFKKYKKQYNHDDYNYVYHFM